MNHPASLDGQGLKPCTSSRTDSGNSQLWQLLPFCLLVSCAVNDRQGTADGDPSAVQARIVRQVELPLESATVSIGGQSARRVFQRQGVQGWLGETGAWHIEGEVEHGRLRCATYQVGIQLGRGNPVCAEPEWLTGVEYGTRLRQCNSAARLHAGGGVFSSKAFDFSELSCVRIVVSCEGAC